jgi:hypothetical protein
MCEDKANVGLTHFVDDDCPGGHAKNGGRAGSARFHAILRELGALHDRKQRDYGTDEDPFANVRASSEWGVPAWIGTLIRATDKLRRLQKYARVGKLANEAVEDSFRDLAVYTVIGLVLYEEIKQEENNGA